MIDTTSGANKTKTNQKIVSDLERIKKRINKLFDATVKELLASKTDFGSQQDEGQDKFSQKLDQNIIQLIAEEQTKNDKKELDQVMEANNNDDAQKSLNNQ